MLQEVVVWVVNSDVEDLDKDHLVRLGWIIATKCVDSINHFSSFLGSSVACSLLDLL